MDHGILNTPLKSRGDIDNQIDAYKTQVAKDARVSAKARAAELAGQREAAKALVASLSDERVKGLAAKLNKPVGELRKWLKSESHWSPHVIIKAFGGREAA